jgi:hypothetical protein
MSTGYQASEATGSVKILFLGQCLQYGYQGVDASSTFVALASRKLKARFPDLDIKLDLKHLNHPNGLKAILRHRLLLAKPDIVVISVPASFAILHWRVNLIYEIAPEVIDTTRSFLQKIDAKIKGQYGGQATEKLLNKLSAVHPPLPLDQYERLIQEGIEMSQAAGCRAVIFGPGHFNEDSNEGYPPSAPRLWSSVNAMVRCLSVKYAVPLINAAEALAEHSGEVFLPNNVRFSRYGHEVVARETESVLGAQIAALKLGAQDDRLTWRE